MCLSNFVLGSQNSLSIEIKDQDHRGGWITGELVILDNLKKSNSIEIYWANNPYIPLGQYSPLIKILKKDKKSSKLKIKLNNLKIPPGATHLIINSVQENNHSISILSYPIEDDRHLRKDWQRSRENAHQQI